MPRLGSLLVLLLVVAVTIGCDRVTKRIAVASLADEPRRSFAGDTIRLEYAENTGAFLGIGSEWPASVRNGIFVAGNAVLLLAMVIVAVRQRWSDRAMVGVALFGAGGVSNLVDRIARGSVVDFMNLGIGPVRTGIFNVADVAIMVGVGLLVLSTWQTADASTPAPPPTEPQADV
jgi:signal peptidase II